jgi:hypothetical protein
MLTTSRGWTVSTLTQKITVHAGGKDWQIPACRVVCSDGSGGWLWQFQRRDWNWRSDDSPFGGVNCYCVFDLKGRFVSKSKHQGEALHLAAGNL